MSPTGGEADDRRFMAAALRLSRRHLGLTSTNPSVGALIVRDDGGGPVIVGRGVTAPGGRPHAETEALKDAGALARGATAYVTLEPCAHHGRTPPCAEALAAAHVARVVVATGDPDPRVAGRGIEILGNAAIPVSASLMAEEAAELLSGYLIRSVIGRPEVTLKLALSRDGMIGRRGAGQVAITSAIARRQVHLMRAEADAVLVGIGTVLADDPELTVRLPGLEDRSPTRIVLDPALRLPLASKLPRSAGTVPLIVVCAAAADAERRKALEGAGAQIIAAEPDDTSISLPALLAGLGARGMSSLLVEGGAATAARFLQEGLVDRLALFEGPGELGPKGIASPVDFRQVPSGFRAVREAVFGSDHYREWVRSS